MVAAGYRVSVICPCGDGQQRRQVLESVHIYTYAPPPATAGLASYALEFIYCWVRTFVLSLEVSAREGFDVIQACNPPDTYFALALLYRPFGKRFVYDQHDLCPEVYQSRFQRTGDVLHRSTLLLEAGQYRVADHVIVTNRSYFEVATTRGRRDPADVTVVRSGPDPKRMQRVPEQPELRNGREFLCCWLGIMGPQDGVDLLLESVRVFVRELGRTDTQFAILGYGDCLDEMKALATKLDLDDFVTFTGRVGPERIATYLSTASVGLSSDPMNPLNDVSTMNKTMEYMAYGLPVIAYDLKETRVSGEDAAVYIEPDDAVAYAKAIAAMLDDPTQRATLGAIGRARIESVLSWDEQVPGYVGAFDKVLGRATQKEMA